MNELQRIREKYHNKNFIEITGDIQLKVINWLAGGKYDAQKDIRVVCKRICERGFIKFLDEGVVIITHSTPMKNIGVYPFKFTDNGTLVQSIYITNHITDELEMLCKVEVGTDVYYNVVEGTYNEKLAAIHMGAEFRADKLGMSTITEIIKIVNEDQPNLKPASDEWNRAVTAEYFRTVIKAQVYTMIGIHTYLALLEKEILVSKIEQKRVFNASDKGGKKSKRNPLYRYVVQLPPNYKPRTFNVNYVLSKWDRSGFTTLRWVRPENAEVLAQRRNGKVTEKTKGALVGIEIPISPAECFRRKKSVAENIGTKIYSS